MTDKPVHNPFAIPAVSQPSWSSAPVVEWRGEWPLVPWLVQGHLDLWAPVDHTEERFQRFVERGPQPMAVMDTLSTTGHVVVVSGPKGAGKTSLIHRCAGHLAERLAEARGVPPKPRGEPWGIRDSLEGVSIVPLGGFQNVDETISWDDKGDFVGISTINQRIRDMIVEQLGSKYPPFAEKAQQSPYADDLSSENLWKAYRAISRTLVALQHCALIIIPKILWLDQKLGKKFLRTCSGNAHKGMVFFVESSNSQLEQDLRDEFGQEGANITHLAIGGLRDQDCARFVRRRMAAEGHPSPKVTVTDDAVDGHRPDEHYRSVRDLQDIFYGASQEAIEDQKQEINLERLRRFQEERTKADDLSRSR